MPQNQAGRETFQRSAMQHKLHTHIPRRKFALKMYMWWYFHCSIGLTIIQQPTTQWRHKEKSLAQYFSFCQHLLEVPWRALGFTWRYPQRQPSAVCMAFFPWLCKGCASVRRQRSKRGGRKKERGRREVKERDPHPASFLRALVEMCLYFLKLPCLSKRADKRNTRKITSTNKSWRLHHPSFSSNQLSFCVWNIPIL